MTAALAHEAQTGPPEGRIILARHAAVAIDTTVSSRKWHLSTGGKDGARTMARSMARFEPTVVVSSSEPKALETGQIVAAALSIPQDTAPGLGEHRRDKSPFFRNRADFEATVTTLLQNPDRLVFGRESGRQARERFAAAVARLVETRPGETVAIITHGTVMTLFLAHHNPALNIAGFWRDLTLPCYFVLALPSFTLLDCYYAGSSTIRGRQSTV